jgi:AcrR family transcriptional regulator
MQGHEARQRILDAALRLVAEEGAEAASLRRIGAAAGLHNSSLFHYFAGKEAIHDALAERVTGAAAARVAFLATDDPPRVARLIDALGDLAEHLAERPDEAAYLARALSSGTTGAWAAARERATAGILAPIWQWLVRARDAGEIRPVRPQPTTLQLVGLVLLEPAWARAGPGAPQGSGLRPALRARRRELADWVRSTLAAG